MQHSSEPIPFPKGKRLKAWASIGLPLLAALVVGVLADWIHLGFAIILGPCIFGYFLWWRQRYSRVIRRHYTDLRGEDLRRALRSQRLALGVSVIDGLPDPLLILNKKRDVTLANRAARELFGRTVVGRDLAFTMRQPQVLSLIDETLKTVKPGNVETSIFAPVSRDFHVLVAPLLPPEGEEGAVDFEQLSAEEPALALSLHEITEIRRTESMRADFVANASHELKTPLSNLVGFIETLQGPARDDADARERFLDIMQTEASRMSRLINDLLSLSRIELDEHVRPETPVDLKVLLERIVKLMEMQAGKKQVRLELTVADNLTPVQADTDQLVQVFQNLLDNSIKYSRENGTIRISATPAERLPQSRLAGILIAVEDEGEGIPPEHLPRLTERFYRVDASRSQQLGGTGLGLAIVKHITRRHRGWLDIKSDPGKGTTVIVGLPYYLGNNELPEVSRET